MKKSIIPCAAAAVLLASAGSWALAGNSMSASSNTAATESNQSGIEVPPQTDIAPFQKAKLSLTDAIHAAQQQHEGKTLEARFEMWDGQPAYFVRSCANDRIWEGRINATSGQLTGQPRTFTPEQVTKELNQQARDVRRIHTSLTQAVSDAEQSQGGKAIMATVQTDSNGKTGYDVDVVKNGQLHAAMVDAKTGQVG